MLLCPVASLRMSKLPPEQEQAYERTQKYKEGKFILERAKMVDEYESNHSTDDDDDAITP